MDDNKRFESSCRCISAKWRVEKACRDKRKKNSEGCGGRSSENREQADYSCIVIERYKLCLMSPFQGTPGVLASIQCAQNALRCHLFKHTEPIANRDEPLFIKPLILAARMTT